MRPAQVLRSLPDTGATNWTAKTASAKAADSSPKNPQAVLEDLRLARPRHLREARQRARPAFNNFRDRRAAGVLKIWKSALITAPAFSHGLRHSILGESIGCCGGLGSSEELHSLFAFRF
jgi:hypothetical protein